MADNKVNSGLLEFSEDQKVFVALDAETSEVKKAVTIDGDGVETDIQGVQPSGKKEITTTEEVNVASYATAQVVDEDLVAGNIKKDVDILGVVGSYEPEAPASDFYKPGITLEATGEAGLTATFVMSMTDSMAEFGFVSGAAVTELGLSTDFVQKEVTVGTPVNVNNVYVLNEHKICIFDLRQPSSNIYTTDGDCTVKSATVESDTVYYVEVYGDCSISVEGVR